MNITKRLLSLLVAVIMVLSMIPVVSATEEAAAQTETGSEGTKLPNATVTELDAMVLKTGEYMIWPSGDDSINRPLEIVVNFKAEDTLDECLAGGYSDWLTDFNLTVTGMSGDSITADNCYLAGNYGTFGWIVIPTDGLVLENGVSYPVVGAYDASLNYKDICNSVQNFTAAIHIDQAILDANPDLEVKLDLVMTNPENAEDKLYVGEEIVYTAEELTNMKVGPKATVSEQDAMILKNGEYMVWPSGDSTIDRPLEIVVNFKAEDTLEDCLAGGYSDWLVDFNLSLTGMSGDSITADNCYLAGNYGEFGWIVIPTDGLELENGVTYPVVSAYDASLNYKDICKSVKNFTAAIHIDQAILDANPDLEVKLELVMTNPENAEDKLKIDEPLVYTSNDLANMKQPEAEVTPMGKLTLEEDEYRVWNGMTRNPDITESDALVAGEGQMPLEVLVNFKAKDTLEECLAGGYSQWLVDFNITIEGLENGSVVADNCYLAGNYGSYGWIKIPLAGQTIEEGVAYPVVALYDPTLNYKDICKSVKDFTAAIHIDQAILNANPNMTVKLELVMTNPNNADDTLQIGEDLIYGYDALMNGTVAQNVDTGKLYTDLQEGLEAAQEGETVILLSDVATDGNILVYFGVALDLNGYTLTANRVSALDDAAHIVDSTNGDALLVVKRSISLSTKNEHVLVWTDNGEVAGYRFSAAEFVSQHKIVTEGDSSYLKYGFYFEGDDPNCMLASELMDGGKDNSVEVRVRLSWLDAAGNQQSKIYRYSEKNVMEFAGSWTTKIFSLDIKGYEAVDGLTITPEIVAVVGDRTIVVDGEPVIPAV